MTLSPALARMAVFGGGARVQEARLSARSGWRGPTAVDETREPTRETEERTRARGAGRRRARTGQRGGERDGERATIGVGGGNKSARPPSTGFLLPAVPSLFFSRDDASLRVCIHVRVHAYTCVIEVRWTSLFVPESLARENHDTRAHGSGHDTLRADGRRRMGMEERERGWEEDRRSDGCALILSLSLSLSYRSRWHPSPREPTRCKRDP